MIEETKNYDIFQGTSQLDRFREELKDEFLKIDDRSLPEFVKFISAYAKEINFFTVNDVNDPDAQKSWESFFNRDNLFLFIVISSYDLEELQNDIQKSFDRASATSDKDLRIMLLNDIIYRILRIANTLNYIRKHVQRTPLTRDYIFDMNNEIQRHLNAHLKNLFSLKEKLNWQESTTKKFVNLQQEWGWAPDEEGQKEQQESPEDIEIHRGDLIIVKRAFRSFYYSAFHIKEATEKILENLRNNLKNNKPYIALFLTFIHLYEFAQELQNKIPKKHLDFYYRDVLRLKEMNAFPDRCSVSVQLSKNIDNFLLPENTLISAGKNELNEELNYKTLSPVVLTSSKVQKVNILYKSRDKRHHQAPFHDFVTNLYSKEFKRQEGSFFRLKDQALFGDEKRLENDNEDTLNNGRIGIIVSSTLFRLESGERNIEVSFEFEEEGFLKMKEALQNMSEVNNESFDETVYKAFSTAFKLSISQEEHLKQIHCYVCEVDFEKLTWNFQFQLGMDDDPFIENPVERPNAPLCKDPFIEILLNHECRLYMYSIVENLKLKNIHVHTSSAHLRDLEIYNQNGFIQHSKPFELLGSIPKNGDYFIFGHREAFSKPVETITLNMKWAKNPIITGGFETYFDEYENKKLQSAIDYNPSTSSYALTPSYLKDGTWKDLYLTPAKTELFGQIEKGHSDASAVYSTSLDFHLTREELNPEVIPHENHERYSQDSTGGYIRFTLECPDLGFGHSHYSKLLSETVLHNSRLKKKEVPLNMPNEPIAPVIESVEMSYTAAGSAIGHGSSNENPNNVNFFQLSPFGYKKVDLKSVDHSQTFFDTDADEGHLLLGLDKMPVNGDITLLFDINEDNTDDKYRNRSPIHWSYMRNNDWIRFDEKGLLMDATNGFINSGIIRLQIPPEINRNTTLLDDSLFWIRGSIRKGALSLGKFNAIYENAVVVAWDEAASSVHLDKRLPENTMHGLKDPIPEVAGIIQPNNSYAGLREENDRAFYRRVSERLRHKGRAINAIDYEHLVLQRFPFIYKVKCFMANHTLAEHFREQENLIIPGTVHVAVVPDIEKHKRILKPKVSPKTLNSVQSYLKELVSPFVHINVTNAHYEEIRVICKVQFKGYGSSSYYESLLQEEIIYYFCRWLTDSELEEEFGQSIYKSDVMAYIQNLDYVDFVTEFSIVKIIEDDTNEEEKSYELHDTARKKDMDEEIKATYPWSILVSAPKHNITVINDPAYSSPTWRGVDNMELGSDFIIIE